MITPTALADPPTAPRLSRRRLVLSGACAIAFAALVVVSANDILANSPGIFLQNAPELVWWDTGTTFIALAAVTYFFTRARKPRVSGAPPTA